MILDDIVARKKERLAALKERSVQKELEKAALSAPEPRDFFAALKYAEKPGSKGLRLQLGKFVPISR